jgi:hypothetical protein
MDLTTINVETISHELGHAINDIYGGGTSGVFIDGQAAGFGTAAGNLLSIVYYRRRSASRGVVRYRRMPSATLLFGKLPDSLDSN